MCENKYQELTSVKYLFQLQVLKQQFHQNQMKWASYATQSRIILVLLSTPESRKDTDSYNECNKRNADKKSQFIRTNYLQTNTWDRWHNIMLDWDVVTTNWRFYFHLCFHIEICQHLNNQNLIDVKHLDTANLKGIYSRRSEVRILSPTHGCTKQN